MSRPALSALRALEILDVMAGQPTERFTLSDIVRLTGTNAASCHAILNAMVQSGYLLRDPERKTYRLAPVTIAIGEAAARHDPLYMEAVAVARATAERTGLGTLLSARAGKDIIGIGNFGPNEVPEALRIGQRVPIRAPLGGLFYAWAEEEEQEKWCAPDGAETPVEKQRAHEFALDLLRRRGFLLSLRTPEHGAFTKRLDELEAAVPDPRLAALLRAMDNVLYQPPEIDPAKDYLIQNLSVPIFDRYRRALYIVSVSYPPSPLPGSVALAHARELIDDCGRASSVTASTRKS